MVDPVDELPVGSVGDPKDGFDSALAFDVGSDSDAVDH